MGLLSKLFGSKPSVDFSELIKNGAKIIDVRSPSEFKSGNAKGSVNIPLDTLDQKIDTIKKMNAPIILVCKSGGRASMAKNNLAKNGIEAHNAGAWQNLN